ncbi:MAG: hypothetical protein KAS36_01945, partial [Anaerolineales bacterium]|nr:hypothetical protein [Anaerolineales bacterium]
SSTTVTLTLMIRKGWFRVRPFTRRSCDTTQKQYRNSFLLSASGHIMLKRISSLSAAQDKKAIFADEQAPHNKRMQRTQLKLGR